MKDKPYKDSKLKALSYKKHRNKMDGSCNHLVFVYGTLKKGEPNHYILQDPANGTVQYIGKAKTIKMWPLVIASRYNIPFLLFQENQGKQVNGEVYSVDNAMLDKLDELECHPKYYERILEEVQFAEVAADGTYNVCDVCKLWIYFLKNFRAELLNFPCLEDYSSKGPHGLEYVERYKRPSGVGYHVDVMNI